MNRRKFIAQSCAGTLGMLVLPVMGCGRIESSSSALEGEGEEFVTVYDTYAQALYMDGTLGPKTGTITAQMMAEGQALTLQFWHGHGGKQHAFTVTEENFIQLKRMERVYIVTTDVGNHTHRLFIDPKDIRWRVPGSQGIQVPLPPQTES